MALVKGPSVFVPQAGQRERYRLGKDLERALVVLLMNTPELYARIGAAMQADGFEEPEAKLIFSAVKSVASDREDAGPAARMIVVGRIRQWVAEGRYDTATLRQTLRFVEAADDVGLPDFEEIAALVAPQLQRLETRVQLETAMTTFQKREDLAPVLERLDAARRIGVAVDMPGVQFGENMFDGMSLDGAELLSTGIMELDEILDGGIERKTIATYLAASNVGKSQMLIQSANASAVRGYRVAYATLESTELMTNIRLLANLTGFSTKELRTVPATRKQAIERMANITSLPGYGGVKVRYFAPVATHLEEVLAWADRLEGYDVLIIDYADKLGARKVKDDTNGYARAQYVYDGARAWALAKDKWVITASQIQRQKEQRRSTSAANATKVAGLDDVADSMHKVRTADYVISLNKDGDGAIRWHAAKVREGQNEQTSSAVYPLFACARIGPISWPAGVPADGRPTVVKRSRVIEVA